MSKEYAKGFIAKLAELGLEPKQAAKEPRITNAGTIAGGIGGGIAGGYGGGIIGAGAGTAAGILLALLTKGRGAMRTTPGLLAAGRLGVRGGMVGAIGGGATGALAGGVGGAELVRRGMQKPERSLADKLRNAFTSARK